MDKWSEYPAMGYKKLAFTLLREGYTWATERKVRALYDVLGIKGLIPVFKTTRAAKHPYGKYPYLLKDKVIQFPN